MNKNAYINVRLSKKLKEKVEAILGDIGINVSAAIEVYFNEIERRKGIPFRLNTKTKVLEKKPSEIAEMINMTGGKAIDKKTKKIIDLYASGQIDYDVAVYAIKKDFIK
jgi:addiction module RelB/DinJ family antitoxin